MYLIKQGMIKFTKINWMLFPIAKGETRAWISHPAYAINNGKDLALKRNLIIDELII